jgi:hypothetical protein
MPINEHAHPPRRGKRSSGRAAEQQARRELRISSTHQNTINKLYNLVAHRGTGVRHEDGERGGGKRRVMGSCMRCSSCVAQPDCSSRSESTGRLSENDATICAQHCARAPLQRSQAAVQA